MDGREWSQVCELAAAVQAVTWETLALADVEHGDTGERAAAVVATHGMHMAVVKLPATVRGLVMLPRR